MLLPSCCRLSNERQRGPPIQSASLVVCPWAPLAANQCSRHKINAPDTKASGSKILNYIERQRGLSGKVEASLVCPWQLLAAPGSSQLPVDPPS